MCYNAIMDKDDVLNFRVPAGLKAALRRAADQDERSMSTMAARILREWLTDKGFYSPEASSAAPRRRRS
jgi:hypothetical protein